MKGNVSICPLISLIGTGCFTFKPCILANYKTINISNHKWIFYTPVHEI